jgi:hypothetical protein
MHQYIFIDETGSPQFYANWKASGFTPLSEEKFPISLHENIMEAPLNFILT